jgi:ankyrin repeat protein
MFPEQAVRIQGIIFFGTPHTSSSTNDKDCLFTEMARLNGIDPQTMNLKELNQISEQFLEESAKATDVKFVSFYEAGAGSFHSKIVGHVLDAREPQAHDYSQVVDQSAATLGPIAPQPLMLDHQGISAYTGEAELLREGIRTATMTILGAGLVTDENKDNKADAQCEFEQASEEVQAPYKESSQQLVTSDGSQNYNVINNTTVTQNQTKQVTNNNYFNVEIAPAPGSAFGCRFFNCFEAFTNFEAELSNDQQDKIMQKLEKANVNAQAGRIQAPASGTLKWLNADDQYAAWLRSENSEILAVLGAAGTGKSVLSAHIFYELDKKYQPRGNALILHYFIDESTSNQGDAEVLLLQALMSQVISEHREALAEMPSSRFNSMVSERAETLMDAFGELLSKTRVEYLHIIVDALDECDSKSQGDILRRLATISLFQHVIATRIYVSCRSTTPAAKTLENFSDPRPTVKLLRIMQDKLREDIDAVVKAMIDRFIKIGIVAEIHRSRLAGLLVRRAEDTFIWLAAASPVLEEDNGLSYAELETLVHRLPPQLEKLYESRLLRFHRQEAEVVGNIFRAIRESFRKLTSQEVIFLISLDKQDSKAAHVRDGCKIKDGGIGLTKRTKHLVAVDKDDRVSFMHSTLKDALTAFADRKMSIAMEPFQASEVDCHRFLAERCMRFLLLDEFDNYAHKVEEEEDDDYYGLGSLFLSAQDFGEIPLYEYAANNWWKHLHVGSLFHDTTLNPLAMKLIEPPNKQPPEWCQYLHAVAQGSRTFPETATPIEVACYCGFSELLKDKEFSPEGLYWAVRTNNLDCAQALLQKDNITMDWTGNEWLRSSLYAAAEGGHIDTFRALVQAGASAAVNERNDIHEGGKTPLMIAVAGGHVEIVTDIMALEHVDPSIEDHYGRTAIFFAGNKDVLVKILERPRTKVKAKVKSQVKAEVKHVDQTGRNILSHACSQGEVEIARLLINNDLVDINASDNIGMTPLIRAVCANNLDIVKLLLGKARIDINKQDNEGRNAVSWAAQAPDFQILKSLCDKDISGINVSDKNGWLPFAWTISPKQNEEHARLLLLQDERHLQGKTGLDMFAYTLHDLYRAETIAKLLIAEEAFDINTESDDGRTALSYACEKGSKSLVELILKAPGIDGRLAGNTLRHLYKVLAERERTRDREITAKIRTLLYESLK